MNIAVLTIEIWEMILIVFLVFTIGYVSVNFNDEDLIKANTLTSKIKYISYLIENSNIKAQIKVEDKTIITKD